MFRSIFTTIFKGLMSSAFAITKFNPLNAELNPICHLLALLGAHPILQVSRVRVKGGGVVKTGWSWLRIGTGGGHLWVR
jgi:hypothetical protein